MAQYVKKELLKDQDKDPVKYVGCPDCGALIRRDIYVIGGLAYCSKHFLPRYEKAYDTSPDDTTARFLIKKGFKSDYWKHCTEEQRQYTKKKVSNEG